MKTISPVRLASGAAIGHGRPAFVVAEIGNNHQGELAVARQMVERAAKAGADAVKFQKRDMNALFTGEGLQMPYSGPNSFGKTYGEHRIALELSVEDMAQLRELSHSLGLVFFASAWDQVSMAEMLEVGLDLIKICSADLVNVPLLRHAQARRSAGVSWPPNRKRWAVAQRPPASLRLSLGLSCRCCAGRFPAGTAGRSRRSDRRPGSDTTGRR